MVLFSGHVYMVEVGWDDWALAIFSQEKKNFKFFFLLCEVEAIKLTSLKI